MIVSDLTHLISDCESGWTGSDGCDVSWVSDLSEHLGVFEFDNVDGFTDSENCKGVVTCKRKESSCWSGGIRVGEDLFGGLLGRLVGMEVSFTVSVEES